MTSEARLYTFSEETRKQLVNFRLKSSRINAPQAIIYQINKQTHEITALPSSSSPQVYSSLADLSDALPENTPRFVLLSHPVTSPDNDPGRTMFPYVMLYYLPITCNNEMRMMYAGAKELMRNTSEVQRILDVEDAEEMAEGLVGRLRDGV